MKVFLITHERDYLSEKPLLPLAVACVCTADGVILRACVTDQITVLQKLAELSESVEDIAEQLGVAVLDFSKPWRLQAVHIAKPWGQEIWYTGIEARGVSGVVSATGYTPLDWAIVVAREQVLGGSQPLNLLKILDPLPDDVFGDLYFELHEKKREVYVVTHVDKQAWPDGVGAIRFGFSPEKRGMYASDTEFLADYKNAVCEYRKLRSALDMQMDVLRNRDGIGLHEAVAAAQTRQWLAELPQDIQANEVALRMHMDSFTAVRSLQAGDVLAVPLRTPHALQHGVRTVEFQTPVYERKILSFAQKVLTQTEWDTEEALKIAQLDTPVNQLFPLLHDADGVKIEQIVQFDDFVVQRIYLAPGAIFTVDMQNHYCLVMVVSGYIDGGGVLLEREQAILVPAAAHNVECGNSGDTQAILLLAFPVDV